MRQARIYLDLSVYKLTSLVGNAPLYTRYAYECLILLPAALYDTKVRNSDTLLVLCNREGLLAGKAVKDPAKQQWPAAGLVLHISRFVQLHMQGVPQG